MGILRSERWSALLLIGAAAIGLVLANTPAGPTVINATHFSFGFPGLRLSAAHWVTDGLLAIFFFLAAIELKHELTHGELNGVRKAIVPAAAALGGVAVPAAIYLAVVHGSDLAIGWPIPTATDIAFALGVLALVGRGLPTRIRALLLALAVLDDLIAILIIAFFFTHGLAVVPLVIAVPVVVAFGLVSRLRPSVTITVALVLLWIAAWVLVALSGIHPTIAGVALGLLMAGRAAAPTRHALEPFSNGIVLPVFAFVAALVAIPTVGIGELSPAFWGIVVALPVGKLIGITAGALLAIRLTGGRNRSSPPLGDVLAVAALGGIGFTVSLLMNQLAWTGRPELADEGTLAVIAASVIAAITGVVITSWRARRYRGGLRTE
jgi:NhaA family Na+:H+ antiporter